MSINRTFDAIIFYKFLTVSFPDNPQSFIGLANAYFADGNKGLALRNYRLALKLDPQNNFVSNMINKISGQR